MTVLDLSLTSSISFVPNSAIQRNSALGILWYLSNSRSTTRVNTRLIRSRNTPLLQLLLLLLANLPRTLLGQLVVLLVDLGLAILGVAASTSTACCVST